MQLITRGKFIARRTGLTLIEVMIATTITLLMLLTLAQGFKTLSESVSAGRSKLALSDQLRGVSSLLRNDLEGITVDGSAPQSAQNANGYFKYYDGPICDFTAALYNYLPTGTVEQRLSANRWGDIDDVIMFTCKAKPGQWFRGKIPLALIYVHLLNKGQGSSVPQGLDWNVAWATDITISSEYAEIAWFMRPLRNNDLSSTDPAERYPIHVQELQSTGYGVPPETSVEDLVPVVDLNQDGIPDPDGFPDRVALCRRVLLIRPDLNISETPLSSAAFAGRDPQLVMKPFPASNNVIANRYMLRFAYQRSDLSVRAVTNEFVGTNLTLQTNTLADLQLPENRFAHTTLPLSSLQVPGAVGFSMPILALTSESASSGNYLEMTNNAYGALSPAFTNLSVRPLDRGFIPSCFFRTKITLDSGTPNVVARAIPTLEEVVASNVVAFDVKGFDPSVNLLSSPGADGAWGAIGIDDNGDGTMDDIGESGFPGTDDIALTPSDPGYSKALINASRLGTPRTALPQTAGSGAFVDLDWPRKVIHAPHRLSLGPPQQLGMQNSIDVPNTIWNTTLSFTQSVANGAIERTDSMIKSGCFVATPQLGAIVYQPTFDTFTDSYESDGELIRPSIVPSLGFVDWVDGGKRFGFPLAAFAEADQGTDGLGNDLVEKETSPPVPYKLPSIQVTIRVQDVSAGTLQQISVVQDLN